MAGFGCQVLEGDSGEPPVKGLDHVGAFAHRMLGRAVQCVLQEVTCRGGLCDQFLQSPNTRRRSSG
jgi:hypothetical protein